MKPESTTEIETIQPRFVSSDRCGTCETFFQPNITGGTFGTPLVYTFVMQPLQKSLRIS